MFDRHNAACSLMAALLLGACGGGGGGGGESEATLAPSRSYAQQCSATNPYRADADAITTSGSLTVEKQWLRSYFNEAYLWYDTVPAVDASALAYSGPMTTYDTYGVPLPLSNYFHALKTTAITTSGSKQDKFSFTYPTKAWNDLSQSGTTSGYGIEWMAYSSVPPRQWRIALVQPGSPAASAGLQRGDTLTGVDGVDFIDINTQAGVDSLNAGLFPNAGETHTFVFARAGNIIPPATLTASATITIDPVPLHKVLDGTTVGYIAFTDHIATSEAKLIAAIGNLKAQGITDLVIDLRYNGGGYLYIASGFAYMIAGPSRTSGKYFEQYQYNTKRSAENSTLPFYDTSTSGTPLPTLGLSRIFVLTQGSTCSASESLMNGLAGIDAEVIQIGGTTCGKPYGFLGKDNCGVSYFPMEFKGANQKGFSDFSDGFSPVSSDPGGAKLPGCPATDDLDHNLGDTSEAMLATALFRLNTGSCPVVATSIAKQSSAISRVGQLVQSPARQNGILRNPLGR